MCSGATDAPQQMASLFDHLVGSCEQHRWYGQAERLSCLEVDHEFELRWQLNRQIGRLFSVVHLVADLDR